MHLYFSPVRFFYFILFYKLFNCASAGIKATSKATRKEWRTERHVLEFQSSLLIHLDKNRQRATEPLVTEGANSPACPRCGHDQETGHHIAFHCPTWEAIRTSLIGDRKNWGDLGDPIWIRTGPDKDDIFDGAAEWFSHIFSFMT